MPDLEKIAARNQLRANRRHALNAWLADTDSGTRWAGDDGRRLFMDEMATWPAAVKTAEQTKFDELDAVYEAEKTRAGL